MLILISLKNILPVEGIKLRIAWAKVVFPEPDSPTIPNVVPFCKKSDISSTALKCPIVLLKKPFLIGKYTFKFFRRS